MLLCGILLQTFLVIVTSFVLTTVESQTLSVYPPNVAAQSGEHNVLLGCNVTGLPAYDYIEWLYYPIWDPPGLFIYSTRNGINNDPIDFTVPPKKIEGDTHSLDLVINMVQPEMAARYHCGVAPINTHGKFINVVVLDPVECPSSVVEYDEGTEANISCSVNFYDSTQTYAPMIMWYRDGQPVPGVHVIVESPTRKTAILTKNMTSADDNKKFVCIVDFLNSKPDYTDNCSTVVYVRHVVSEITFDPPSSAEAPIDVAIGDVINCIANGRPDATIVWYDNYWNLLSELRELVVTEDMRSREQPITLYCRASSDVKFAYVEANYTFNVVGAEPRTTVPSYGTGQMVSIYPPNVGAQSGEQNVLLSCNVTGLPPNNYIQWIYYPTWVPTGFTIYSTYNGINNDPTNFTVLPMTTVDDTKSLDLVINTAKPELATRYHCDLSGFGKRSNVVVLDKIYCSNDVVEYDEGNEANILCSVNYSNYDSTQTYAPRITWKRDGQEVPGVVHISDSNISKTKVQQVRLIKNVTAADNDRDFVCVVDFLHSTPDYTDNCYTTVFVRHPVSEITFDPPSSAEDPTNVTVGDVINCIANGRPAPTIEWYTKHWNLVSTLSELTVSRDMRSWKQPITLYCKANNTIDNGVTLAMVVGIYTFNVVDAEPIVPWGGTTATTTNGTATTTNDAVGEISFYPPSSAEAPTELVVGAHIICIVHGKSYATIEWYGKYWNSLSGWKNQLTVTKEMRYSEQPITLHCRARNQKNYSYGETIAAVEASYTFNVVDAEPIVPWGRTTAARTTTTNDAVGEISFYPPSSAEAPAELEVGAPIICLVHGKSYATIYWYDKHWNWVSGWNQVTVTKEMRYSEQPITLHCRVTNQKNYYGGDMIAAVEASYTFNVSGAIEPWVIAMVVIVSIVVLVAIAIAVFFIIRHRRMKEKSSAMTTMKGGSTSARFVNY